MNEYCQARPGIKRAERGFGSAVPLLLAVFAISCAGKRGPEAPTVFGEPPDEGTWIVIENEPRARTPFVRVGPDGRTFRRGRDRFIPFGCNYYDPDTGWPPHLWQQFDEERVAKQFTVMRTLGVNCVRVFLTAQSFFPNGRTLEPEAMDRLETLLEIADENGILVQLTGPDHWEGRPPWWGGDRYTKPESLETLGRFWTLLAGALRDDTRLFSYDILNEPILQWTSPTMEDAWPRWLEQRYGKIERLRKAWALGDAELDAWESIAVPQDTDAPASPALYDYQCFREDLATHWVAVQSDAIRAADPNHLVTVGLVQWSIPINIAKPSGYAAVNPVLIAPFVDFMTVHFYPTAGDPFTNPESFRRNQAYLEAVVRSVDVGLPIVLGEFGWYGGGAAPNMPRRTQEQQRLWNRGVLEVTESICTGWFNWAFADTPSATDISRYSGLVTDSLRVKPWGTDFKIRARLLNRNRPRYRPATMTLKPDYRFVLTSSEASRAVLDEFMELAEQYRRPGIRPHERLEEAIVGKTAR